MVEKATYDKFLNFDCSRGTCLALKYAIVEWRFDTGDLKLAQRSCETTKRNSSRSHRRGKAF